jgi:hypothetical protein
MRRDEPDDEGEQQLEKKREERRHHSDEGREEDGVVVGPIGDELDPGSTVEVRRSVRARSLRD